MKSRARGLSKAAGALACAWLCVCTGRAGAQVTPFATRVVHYAPAPGQNTANPLYNDPARALGAPVGGSLSQPDNSKLVTLGGARGSLTLGFAAPIRNRAPSPGNPRGLDLIVFGNAFHVAGDASRRWAEAGVVEVSRDTNANGQADDAWFLIPGSHITIGEGAGGAWPLLPVALFAPDGLPVVENPQGPDAMVEGVFGYADCTPTLALGDLDGDGAPDAGAHLEPARFFGAPDDPLRVGVSPLSAGGDAIDLSWAVHPMTGAPAGLTSVDFVRISTGVGASGPLGEVSTEVGGVCAVRPRQPADVAGAGQAPGPDGQRTADDIIVFVGWFFAMSAPADIAGPGQVDGPDGAFTADDLIVFIGHFFGPEEEP
jgi:hypothetical protein